MQAPQFRVRSRPRQRGFTLVELMVAVMAGLLVAVAAWSFSKQSTRFFAQEARVAAAQVSVLTGFQRLQEDLTRASFMSTPNMARDQSLGRVCAPDWANMDALIRELAGIRVERGGSHMGAKVGTDVQKLPDGHYPDSVTIVGNFASVEQYPVRTILPNEDGGTDIFLQLGNGAMGRSRIGDDGAVIGRIFPPNGLVRVVDQHGHEEYAFIKSATYASGGQPVIKTSAALPLKAEVAGADGGTGAACGIDGLAVGVQVNPVSIVEYAIGSLRGTSDNYDRTIYSEAGTALGDENRTELLRRQILPGEGPPLIDKDPTTEVVAEYAVDLRLGLWVTTPNTAGLRHIPPSDPEIDDIMEVVAIYPAGAGATGPESVRALDVRLVVRSREVDSNVPIATDGGLMHRFPMPGDGGAARARTLTANVTLKNQRGDAW